MLTLGLDFTSAPSRSKPITCARCTLDEPTSTLILDALTPLPDFPAFEQLLAHPGPFIAAIDFPFSQPHALIDYHRWPPTWPDFITHIASMSKADFEAAVNNFRDAQPSGRKHPLRAVDRLANSCSPLMLHGVPVGKMFFEGAPRILRSGASILPNHPRQHSDRTIVEAYPGVAVRTLMGRKLSYKSDDRAKQTPDKESARRAIVAALRTPHSSSPYALTVRLTDAQAGALIADPTGDTLDAVLCALQAAWAYAQRHNDYGIPRTTDPLEGWIPDPGLFPDAPAPAPSHPVKPSTTRLSTTLSGVAGEYFVAAELSRRGHIASLTQRTTRGIDLLATNESGTRSITIQVKTAQDSGKEWLLDKSAETNVAPNFFYIFVNLKGVDGVPEYHIVPSATVAAFCTKYHQDWLAGTRRDGQPRKDTSMRAFRDPDRTYLNRWDLLGLSGP